MSERCKKARACAKQTTKQTQRERERERERESKRQIASFVHAHAHSKKRNRGIGNNSKKFQTRRVPSQTLRVWIFLCFFNQRIFSVLAAVLLLLLAGTTEEVILVLGDVSRQVVGRVHERELFRQVFRVVGHFF